MDDGLVHFLLLGYVFADGYDVSDLGVIDPHWNLADLPGLLLAVEPRLLLQMDHFAAAEHINELFFQLSTGLANQHLKHIASENLFAIDSEPAHLPISIPRHDSHIPIDDVEGDGKGIDNLLGEPFLLFRLPRSLRYLDRKVD